MKGRIKFSDWNFEKDNQLIELVKNKPELYDQSSIHYRKMRPLKNTWKEIGIQLNIQDEKCKRRWKVIRNRYSTYIKYQTTFTNRKFKYANKLYFLNEFMKVNYCDALVSESDDAENEKIYDNTNDKKINENNAEHVNEDMYSEMNFTNIKESAPTTLIEYSVEERNEEIPLHPVDLFFSKIASSVKQFNPTDQDYAKNIVSSEINKIEQKYLSTQNHGAFQVEPSQHFPLQPYSEVLPQYSIPSTSSSYHVQNYNFGYNEEFQINPAVQPQLQTEYRYLTPIVHSNFYI